MDRIGRTAAITLLLAGAPAAVRAQGARTFCIPGTQACFNAALGFTSNPVNPFFQNRLSSVVTNLQGTYGGLNAPFGFLGIMFVPRWNSLTDPRATLGWFDPPTATGPLAANPFSPGLDFDQPGGGTGYMLLRGTGYLGCRRFIDDLSWTWAGCARDGRTGSVAFDLDLAFVARNGKAREASFQHFALRAITTHGSCTFTPSRWYLEATNDACDDLGVVSTSPMLGAATVAPEPGTLLLLASGLGGLGAARRRARRHRG